MQQPRQGLASCTYRRLRCLPTVGCACFSYCCSWNINKGPGGTIRAAAAVSAASTILIYYFDSCYFSTYPGVAACFTQCVIVLVRSRPHHTLFRSLTLALCRLFYFYSHALLVLLLQLFDVVLVVVCGTRVNLIFLFLFFDALYNICLALFLFSNLCSSILQKH